MFYVLFLNSYLPPGTSTYVHFYSIQRDERNFSPAPNSFWPDRWLIAAGEVKYDGQEPFNHNTHAFLPFSFGPANCVGKNLAMLEMRMVTCLIMQKLEFKFMEGWNPEEFTQKLCDYLVFVRDKLPVSVKPRHKA